MNVVTEPTNSTSYSDEGAFHQRALDRDLTIAVVGLGYTGLPLAHAFAATGFTVHGVDIDDVKVQQLRRGRSYLPDISDEQLRAVADRLHLALDARDVGSADVVMVSVPTPVTTDEQPDLTFVDSAFASLAPMIGPGTVVVLQSTVPPGTTRRWAQRLSAETGLTLGRDLFVACAPERVNPANRDGWTITNTPRVVGGVSAACTRRAATVLMSISMEVTELSDATVAEMSKLLENSARLVNISFSNEISDLCHKLGVPVDEVIRAAATKPFGYLPHWPGPGIGGECIPVDPLFLITEAGRQAVPMPIIEAAHRQASARPLKVAVRVAEMLARVGTPIETSRVLVLGVAYKPNVPDLRNAPALSIIGRLLASGSTVDYCDPWVAELDVDGTVLSSLDVRKLPFDEYDCVVLVTPHEALDGTIDWQQCRLVLDTVHRVPAAPNVERL
ncbi:nucleotide sugar dehydrogenase [Micromonospora sp. NPDC020750]|uniref:nucleotide sugar dehydrogenase n=1 Tax=unclassified Micromonospora TaxID=2617518 RepID=UPI00378AF087